jgi:hypothetical protein
MNNINTIKTLNNNSYLTNNIGCSFKIPAKVGFEESIVNAPLVSLQSKNTKSEIRFKQLIRDL